MTSWSDIEDVITITIGPHRPGQLHPWSSGVTMLLDDTRKPFGALIMKGRLPSHAVPLPLRGLIQQSAIDK